MKNENKTSGKRIAELRENKGLTQDEFADLIGVTRSNLSLIETDKRKIPSDVLISISNALCVSADYILCISNVPSLDTNIQAVCEFTGLSEKAVKNITLINEQYRKDITFEDFVKLSAHKSE